MDDAIHLVSRIGVRRRTRCLEAAALVDSNVHDHGSLAHRAQHAAADKFRRASTWNEHCANNDVCGKYLVLEHVYRREPGTNTPVEQLIEFTKPR
jgi:hypothetical protein